MIPEFGEKGRHWYIMGRTNWTLRLLNSKEKVSRASLSLAFLHIRSFDRRCFHGLFSTCHYGIWWVTAGKAMRKNITQFVRKSPVKHEFWKMMFGSRHSIAQCQIFSTQFSILLSVYISFAWQQFVANETRGKHLFLIFRRFAIPKEYLLSEIF